MDMSKYRGMFLSEATEHLASMSRLVITLEDDPANREVIDTLFREAHSIKGMAASMGYDQTAELAHHLEDLMDGFRKTGEVPATAVDRILAGIDILEGLLDDISSERPEREIESFIFGTPAPQAVAPLTPPPSSSPPLAATSPAQDETEPAGEPESGADTLQLTIELAADAAAPTARALLLLRELAGLGRVISSQPAEAQLRQGMPVRQLDVVVETRQPAEMVCQHLATMSDVKGVHLVESPGREAAARRDEGGRTVRVSTDLLDRFVNLTGELITTRYMLQRSARDGNGGELRDGLDLLARLVTDLHLHVLQVRMMPLESITGRLPRLVRDLCRKTGKDVRLRIEGEDLELDRAILEGLADPLVHMVRNAVDHGIATSGEVTVRAWREKDLALLEVTDNGRGMDPAAIRAKAVEKGLVSAAQARGMRDRDILQLVCVPGFSTAATVTETSGRGVGMDVVKTSVESLGGTLEIVSEPGAGTRIVLKLPLTVAIIHVLLVNCGGRLLGIPITRVYRAMEIPRSAVKSSGRQMVIALDDEMVPLVLLNRVLDLPPQGARDTLNIVISEARGRKIGLVIDSLAGQREVFVKTLAFPLDRLAGVSGATVLGDGQVVFIIDPATLLEGTGAAPLAAASGA